MRHDIARFLRTNPRFALDALSKFLHKSTCDDPSTLAVDKYGIPAISISTDRDVGSIFIRSILRDSTVATIPQFPMTTSDIAPRDARVKHASCYRYNFVGPRLFN
jgi:hypothetical protein